MQIVTPTMTTRLFQLMCNSRVAETSVSSKGLTFVPLDARSGEFQIRPRANQATLPPAETNCAFSWSVN